MCIPYICILYSAVCSTMISMLFLMMSSSNALLWIDCVVNIICVILMTEYYPGMYSKVCCCCTNNIEKLLSSASNNGEESVPNESDRTTSIQIIGT